MKQLALIFVMYAIASSAQAGGDRPSLFACGINFGGKQLSYSPASDSGSKKDYSGKRRGESHRLHRVIGASAYALAHPFIHTTAQPDKREKRLPRKFTFATIGCSWR